MFYIFIISCVVRAEVSVSCLCHIVEFKIVFHVQEKVKEFVLILLDLSSLKLLNPLLCSVSMLKCAGFLVPHRALPQVTDSGTLTRYGWYQENKIRVRTKTSIGPDGLHVMSGTPTATEESYGKLPGYNFPMESKHGFRSRAYLNEEMVQRIARSTKVYIHKPKFRIGTWSIRSLYQAGKMANIIQEMKRLQIDILACSEIHWHGNAESHTNNHQIYYIGNDSVESDVEDSELYEIWRKLQIKIKRMKLP